MTKFKFTFQIAYSGELTEDIFELDDFGITEEDWASTNKLGQNEFMQKEVNNWVNRMSNCLWVEIKEE